MVDVKPCDGTWQDYQRHKRRDEAACPASKAAWRVYIREGRSRRRKGGSNE